MPPIPEEERSPRWEDFKAASSRSRQKDAGFLGSLLISLFLAFMGGVAGAFLLPAAIAGNRFRYEVTDLLDPEGGLFKWGALIGFVVGFVSVFFSTWKLWIKSRRK